MLAVAWTLAGVFFVLMLTTAMAGQRARCKLVVIVMRSPGPHTIESLARSLREDRRYVQSALKSLERHGFVERFDNMRGEACFELTSAGKALGPDR